MALTPITSPHTRDNQNTTQVMQTVLLATIPGLLALTVFFGWGTLINIVIAVATAIGCEAVILKVRNKPITFYLSDYSAVVTAVLLALALPPLAPWWITVVGTAFAIVVAKHLYGGLGYNPFNPAMVGYVVLLISFPVQMTAWPAPYTIMPEGISVPGLWQSLQIVFPFLAQAAQQPVDAYTAATALDIVKHNHSIMLDQLYAQETLFQKGELAGSGWDWVNIGFLVGGIFLLTRKIFTWHAPVGMLAALAVFSVLFYDGGSSGSKGSPIFQLFSGATMLGAFFIVTDPVTSAASNKGRLIYGALVGLLVFIIRGWGSYPDALAFAVLLMNFAAPLIDNYTLPRTYGQAKARRATEKKAEE